MRQLYLSSDEGDNNHIDIRTRERMVRIDSDASFSKLLMLVFFVLGMIVGSTLHDSAFHAIEQVMK